MSRALSATPSLRTYTSKRAAANSRWAKAHPEQMAGYSVQHRLRHPERYMLRAAKSRAKQRGLPFNLTYADIVVPAHCPILGLPLKHYHGEGPGGRPDSASLDRLVPELGYVAGNVQVISHLANTMKATASIEHLRAFAAWVGRTFPNG